MRKLQTGDMITAHVLDPQGNNPKDRPAVIVSSPGSMAGRTDDTFFWICCGTKDVEACERKGWEYVVFPWHTAKHPWTGLRVPTAFAGQWLVKVQEKDVLRKEGHAPDYALRPLLQLLRDKFDFDE